MNQAGYRHEDKYLIDPLQTEILKERAGAVLQRDIHTGANGTYRIRSLYFDDRCNKCYLETENGSDPRAKFRIRIYNDDPGMIRLEKKIKTRGLTRKLSAVLTREECGELMAGRSPELSGEEDPAKKELLTELAAAELRPAVIIGYERLPFTYAPFNIRFTIDTKLWYSEATESFLEEIPHFKTPARMEAALSGIMELKWDDYLPSFITEYLALETLQLSRFSKYHYCRAQTM